MITIKTLKDGSTLIRDEDGKEIKNITAVDIEMRPAVSPVATLSIFGVDSDLICDPNYSSKFVKSLTDDNLELIKYVINTELSNRKKENNEQL